MSELSRGLLDPNKSVRFPLLPPAKRMGYGNTRLPPPPPSVAREKMIRSSSFGLKRQGFFVRRIVAAALLPLTCCLAVGTSFNVVIPESLNKPEGYDHCPALFGIPPYGESLRHNLFYAGSTFCDVTNFAVSSPDPFILLIDRGECTFVKKARQAQANGAVAVAIADNVCLCSDQLCVNNNPASPCEIMEPIMADDGSGADIVIPSILIFKNDADRIKGAITESRSVVVEMTWEQPKSQDGVVNYEIFTTPTDASSRDFLWKFKPDALDLGNRAYFTPHSYIYDGIRAGCLGPNGENSCFNLCTNNGRYCSTDPDGELDQGISGADVVRESLRRTCIWKEYGGDGVGEAFWEYIVNFDVSCTGALFSNERCIEQIYTESNIDGNSIANCIEESGGLEADGINSLLDQELATIQEKSVVFLPTVFVEGVPLSGDVTPRNVLGAICEAYMEEAVPVDVCVGELSVPGSGAKILYVKTDADDNPGFREAVSSITGGDVDLFLAGVLEGSTPSLEDLSGYDCVMIHYRRSFANPEQFGNVIADYVDSGGTIVFSDGGFLRDIEGRFKEGSYSPVTVPQFSTELSIGDLYLRDGRSILYEGIASFRSVIDNRDEMFEVKGDGVADGTFERGIIAAAYKPDWSTIYLNGSYCWGSTYPGGYCLGGDHPRRWANACSAALVANAAPNPSPSSFESDTPTSSPFQNSRTPTARMPGMGDETQAPYQPPTSTPSGLPTGSPLEEPTNSPTADPSSAPSRKSSEAPSNSPTELPSGNPSLAPSVSPTVTPNNVCEKAIELAADGSISLGLTREVLPTEISRSNFAPQCGPLDGLWYAFVGGGSLVEISTCHSQTQFSTAIAIYSGKACEEVVLYAWIGSKPMEDACENGGSTFLFVAAKGERYYILVHGDDASISGTTDSSATPQTFGAFGLSIKQKVAVESSPAISSSAAFISRRLDISLFPLLILLVM